MNVEIEEQRGWWCTHDLAVREPQGDVSPRTTAAEPAPPPHAEACPGMYTASPLRATQAGHRVCSWGRGNKEPQTVASNERNLSSSCGGQRPEIQVVSHAPSRGSFLVSSGPWRPLAISGWWEHLCTCALVAFLPPHLCVSLCVFSPPLLRTPAIGFRADPNPIWLHLNWATSVKHVFPKGCSLRFWGNIHFGEALLNLEQWDGSRRPSGRWDPKTGPGGAAGSNCSHKTPLRQVHMPASRYCSSSNHKGKASLL